MTVTNSFFAVYTCLFFSLYTYSIGYEINSLHNKIDRFQNEYREFKKDLEKDTKEIREIREIKELYFNKNLYKDINN